MSQDKSVLTYKDLKERKGVTYSRQHLSRLVREGRFPKPFKLAGHGLNMWRERDIDDFFDERAKAATK